MPDYLNKSFPFQIGDKIEVNRHLYTVRQIKEGGMGVVFLLDSDSASVGGIAAKTFRPEVPLPEIVSELNIWLDLIHPNILRLDSITVIDFDTAAVSSWRRQGSVYEYLVKKQRLERSDVKTILLDAISALQYAWETKHILHLDIKPQNMLIKHAPPISIQVSDWGLARISSAAQIRRAASTPGGEVHLATKFAGTIPYMAPERFVSGTPASIQTDIFSLGILAVECLSGTLPFSQGSNLIEQILGRGYIARAKIATDSLGSRWQQFLLRCLAFDRNHRFKTYPEMQKALNRL